MNIVQCSYEPLSYLIPFNACPQMKPSVTSYNSSVKTSLPPADFNYQLPAASLIESYSDTFRSGI